MDNRSIARNHVKLNNEIELAYYDSNDFTKQDSSSPKDNQVVVVLLHGYCGSSAYWEKVVPLLEQHMRVLVPDLRGHGASSTPTNEIYTMEMYADDIAGMLEQLNIDRICLLGHSLGGYITLSFVEHFSEKLQAFGLIHSTSLPDSEAAKENRDNTVAAIAKDGIATFVDGLVPKLYAPQNRETMIEQIERTKLIGYATSTVGAIGAAKGMKERPDRTSLLQQSELPILLLAGEDDQIIPVDRTLMVDGPKVMQVKLEKAGHLGMVEQPEAFANAIVRFVATLT